MREVKSQLAGNHHRSYSSALAASLHSARSSAVACPLSSVLSSTPFRRPPWHRLRLGAAPSHRRWQFSSIEEWRGSHGVVDPRDVNLSKEGIPSPVMDLFSHIRCAALTTAMSPPVYFYIFRRRPSRRGLTPQVRFLLGATPTECPASIDQRRRLGHSLPDNVTPRALLPALTPPQGRAAHGRICGARQACIWSPLMNRITYMPSSHDARQPALPLTAQIERT